NRGKHRLEALANRLGLAGQIDDQRRAANARGLPGEDRGGYVLERRRAHQLAEAGHHLPTDGLGGLGGDVARRGAGAAGGDDEAAALLVAQLDERLLERGAIVGDEAVHLLPRAYQPLGEHLLDRLAGDVVVDARAGAVARGENADARGL